jgi:hypothetical protein
MRCVGEEPENEFGQEWIARDRRYLCVVRHFACRLAADELRIKIEYPPSASEATHGHAIVHLARVQHDDIAGLGLDLPDHAPRALRAGCHDPDAKLVMRVAWEGVVRKQGQSLDPRDGGFVLHDAMCSGDHYCLPCKFIHLTGRLRNTKLAALRTSCLPENHIGARR